MMPSIALLLFMKSIPDRIVEGARGQLARGTTYDNRYVKIAYPLGDVPRKIGVCTDVVVRAYRHAGYDLQVLIHKDMVAAWKSYPRYAGNSKPDTNIDHRRVPNQRVFFRRHGKNLTTLVSAQTQSAWQPGDIVTWKLDNGLDHTGVLSDKRDSRGWPYVIHNLGTPLEEDVLTSWKITGNYRYPAR